MSHSRRTGRYALASAFVIAVIAAPFAVAQTNSNGSGRFVSNDPRYTPTTCFETFPLPWPPGQEPWRDPRVHEKAGQAQQVVQEKAGQAGQAVKEKVASATSSGDNGPGKQPDTGPVAAATTTDTTGTRGGKLP